MFIFRSLITFTFLSFALLAAGCSTTKDSRNQAMDLADKVSVYRAQQNQRIENVNREYHEAFAQLMDALTDLTRVQLQQKRDTDAQDLSDKLISDDKQSLIGILRTAFLQTMQSELKAISDADLAVSQARAAYTSGYNDAKLDLAKLDKVVSDLRALGRQETIDSGLAKAANVIKLVAQTAQDANKNAQAQAGKTTPIKPNVPKAPAGSNPPA